MTELSNLDWSTIVNLIWPLVGTGIIAGLLAGLLGVGGGIVIVPVLYFVFQSFDMGAAEAMSLAVGTSLATIVPTSISSIRAHHQKGNVDWSLVIRWIPGMVIGVLAGASLVSVYQSKVFVFLFALIAVFVALRMFFNSKMAEVAMPGLFVQRAISAFIGFFSVMIGIGGGTLGVPVLTKLGLVAHKAVGTAAVFGLVIALPGVLLMLVLSQTPAGSPMESIGNVNIPSFLCIIPLTILFAPVGVKLAHKLNPATLKKVFAVVLFITSIRMLVQVMGL